MFSRAMPETAISHGQLHVVGVLAFGSDQQLTRAIMDVAHRLRGVTEQIQDDLLELDAIPGDGGEIARRVQTEEPPDLAEDRLTTRR